MIKAYAYLSHTSGLPYLLTQEEHDDIDVADLYCVMCGDGDRYLGFVTSVDELINLYKKDAEDSFCNTTNEAIEEIREIYSNYVEDMESIDDSK